MKGKLKKIWLKVVWELKENPQSINELSLKSGVSWEATKNCLETLSYLRFIDISLKNKQLKYMLKLRIKESEAIELIEKQKNLFKNFGLDIKKCKK